MTLLINTCLDSYLGVHAHWYLYGKPGNFNRGSGVALARVILHEAEVTGSNPVGCANPTDPCCASVFTQRRGVGVIHGLAELRGRVGLYSGLG